MGAYLDNSATTPVLPVVAARVAHTMTETYYNPSALYAPAMRVEQRMDQCRALIRQTLHAPADARVIFTSGGTEANNLALMGAIAARRGPQRIAISAVEHPSVQGAVDALAAQGHEILRIGVDAEGRLNFDQLADALAGGLSMVSCMQVNNETGACVDLVRLSAMVRAASPDTLIHVDGVQGFMRVPFDMTALCDLYSLSGHKIHAPKGIGALVASKSVRLHARALGGGQENHLRSGTENTPGIEGLCAAIECLRAEGDAFATLRAKKTHLCARLLAGIPGAVVNGPDPSEGAPHILNLSLVGVRAEVLLHALEAEGIYVSTGSACSSRKRKASAVLTAMNLPPNRLESAIRMSLSPFTTMEEIDCAAEAMIRLHAQFKRFQRR